MKNYILGKRRSSRFAARWAMSGLCIAGAGLSFADTTIWTGGSGLWDDPTRWSAGVPTAGDDAVLSTDGATTVKLSPSAGTLNSVTVSAPAGPHTLLLAGDLSSLIEIVGDAGSGVISQTAGLNSLPVVVEGEDGRLVLGNTSGGVGTYNLSGGTLQANVVTVGGGTTALSTFGTGVFNHSGGTVDLTVVGTFGELLVGDAAGSTGSYFLSGGNLVADSVFVAVSGTSSGQRQMVQSGGTATVLGDLQIGGFIGTPGANTGTTGSYTLSGTGSSTLSAANVYVGVSGIGTFTQEGGTHSVNGGVAGTDRNLFVGAILENAEGTYNLRSGTLTAETEYIGNPGRGTFLHTGGTNIVNGQLLIDTNATAASSGTYTISGGNLTTTGAGVFPSLLNLNQFNINGGVVTVNGTGPDSGLDNRGTITMAGGTLAGNAGKINAGTLTGYGSIIGTGDFINRGTTTFTGGNTTVQSNTINDAGRLLNISNSVAVFDGNVTNNGTIKTTAANAIFNGDYAGGGSIISDPSTQTFNRNFSVSDPGTLVGDAGDRFRLGLNVTITSSNDVGWKTENAEMNYFKGPNNPDGSHTVIYPGMDLGPTELGYVDNFAWGLVSIESGNELINTSNNALYTRELALGDGVAQISTFTGNLSIYYDPSDPQNGFLAGGTYPFGEGDGFVAPIPEPSACGLLALGVAVLGLRRRAQK